MGERQDSVDPEKHEGLGYYIGERPSASSVAVQDDGSLLLRVHITDTPGRFDFIFAETNGVMSVNGDLRIMRGCKLSGALAR